MDKVKVQSPDLEIGCCFKIDFEALSYEVVKEESGVLAPGNGIEIYLPKEKRKALVAIFSDGFNCKFFCDNHVFDLINTRLTAEVKTSFRNKIFTLRDSGTEVMSIIYRYRDIQDDLLESIAHSLSDPIKNLCYQQMVAFFNEKDLAERMKIDKENTEKLKEARSSYRKKLSWYRKLLDFIKYY